MRKRTTQRPVASRLTPVSEIVTTANRPDSERDQIAVFIAAGRVIKKCPTVAVTETVNMPAMEPLGVGPADRAEMVTSILSRYPGGRSIQGLVIESGHTLAWDDVMRLIKSGALRSWTMGRQKTRMVALSR